MLRTLLKVFGVLVALLVFLGVIGFLIIQTTWEKDYSSVPLPNIVASSDSAVIARGEYLVKNVAHCSTCHSLSQDGDELVVNIDGPMIGGYVWNIPLFGRFVARNITPDRATGIGGMSDGELARAIRNAVDRDGKVLPFMIFGVGGMSDEDLTSVVSWLRAQPPVANETEREQWGLMAKALSGSFLPRTATPPTHVAEGGVSVERGRYLAEGPAFCAGCHTPMDPMTFATVGALLSGNPMAEPDETEKGWEIVAPNLTPDPATGHIYAWDEDRFVSRFREGRILKGSKMPWEAFQGMTEDDVRSIYAFLRSLAPVQNEIGPTRRQVK